MLAIIWANEFDDLSNQFVDVYGTANAAIASQIVNRAINDWEAVISDINLSLDIFADPISGRGATGNVMYSNGRPISADITLDDNGGGFGWLFDSTPMDDAEFTAIANSGSTGTGASFHASFVDVTAGFSDFYRTIVHEIGHAAGLASSSPVFSTNISNPLMTLIGSDPQGGTLYSFHNPNGQYGVTATITTDGGRHLYEGSHPNDLMNAGRITPIGSPRETVRQWISDFDVQLLADAYGYSHVLPSTFDTAHAVLDSQTGTLLVQGGLNSQGQAQYDTIIIDSLNSGATIRVQVNGTSELFDAGHVSQILVARNGGNDFLDVIATNITAPINEAHYVISTNQDVANAGTIGDGIVDHDALVPSRQVSLRSAIMDANGASGYRFIYVPKGTYNLTLQGAAGDSQGDLDIMNSIALIGSGPGATIINASGAADRVFDVNGALSLYTITVTGGQAPNLPQTPWLSHGGAILVHNGGHLTMSHSVLVGNQTTGSSAHGGAIYFEELATGSISSSVITGNHAAGFTGGINLVPFVGGSAVNIASTIVVNNTASDPGSATTPDVRAGSSRGFTSGGNNRLGNATVGLAHGVNGDHVGASNYVVTDWRDTYDGTTDKVAMSLRDAIELANITAGAQEIWLPAWSFRLTRERTAAANAVETDIAQGDLDIKETLTIRGVNNATSVAWRSGAVTDKIFEMLGDYNLDGNVDAADYVTWQQENGQVGSGLAADGDDDSDVDQADYDIWRGHFGYSLTLLGIS